MVDGGRDLEQEIQASFSEKISDEDSVPDSVADRLNELELAGELTESAEIKDVIDEEVSDADSEY
ncbi:hypothetical protein [Halorubrum halophilum]|uniref:hypothetical protein n=1 Tax=Halorubrum halophilum TaxID=413816 RepID=UPI0006790182|nr:hypothetical protein [Halorubrum halophilum]